MDEVEVKEVQWLWYPYIPYGKITIVQGDPGEGKTTVVLKIAALLSKGEKLPFDDTQRKPISIIYQTADCTKIKVIDESVTQLTMLDERLEQAIIKTGARMVILDPIQAYLGADVNMNVANETRSVMARLGSMADKHSCAIILIGHMNKGGSKASYRGLGSIDFQAVARSVLIVGRLKDNPEMRIIAQGKSSLAPEGESIAFELSKENGFRFVGHYKISADELLSGMQRDNKSQLAENLLNEILADGKQAQSEIVAKAQKQGISKRTLDEVKKSLHVKSVKENNKWYWELIKNQ